MCSDYLFCGGRVALVAALCFGCNAEQTVRAPASGASRQPTLVARALRPEAARVSDMRDTSTTAFADAAALPQRDASHAAALDAATTTPMRDQRQRQTTAGAGGTAPVEPPTATTLRLETQVLAAQAGYYATPALGQAGVLTGTDMGWTVAHRDTLWVMFGDSWWVDPLNAASLPDDAISFISLSDFPDGASVESFVREHPARAHQPAWHAGGPTMFVAQRGPGFAPVIATRNGKAIPSGVGRTPLTAFSNGRDDSAEGVFAIFCSYELVRCEAGRCPDGFECDAGLGTSVLELLQPACVVGSSPSCVKGPGYCQDRGTTFFDPDSEMGRALSVAVRHDVGIATPADPTHFSTRPWVTQRFVNATARTVTDFDAERLHGAGNDYRPARGNDLPRAGVFVWGRPYFGGLGAQGRDAQLYLLWTPMPQPDTDQPFTWQPQYFTGVDAQGRPSFSRREVDARPLDLDAALEGEQPEETHDIVGQMAISWVPNLRRFAMFYGGDAPSFSDYTVARGDAKAVRRDPLGRMFVRFAEHPWGPWTAPRTLIAAGDRNLDAPATGLYAPGGILAHNNCRATDCAHYDAAYLLDSAGNNNGVLYGANIIDVWTTQRQAQADLFWFLSTWNPYQVVLMKTTLSW